MGERRWSWKSKRKSLPGLLIRGGQNLGIVDFRTREPTSIGGSAPESKLTRFLLEKAIQLSGASHEQCIIKPARGHLGITEGEASALRMRTSNHGQAEMAKPSRRIRGERS